MKLHKSGFVYSHCHTVGADPEFFIFNGNRLLPAFTFLPNKRHPLEFENDWNNGRTVAKGYWDGFQAEFALTDGNYCLNAFLSSLRSGMMGIQDAARQKHPDAKLSMQSVVRLGDKVLKVADDEHVALGCEPSFNIYNLKGKVVENPRELPYRFAGGHMHFGYDPGPKPDYEKTVKTLDAILGIWSVGAAQSFDSPIRREYYGLPGEFRKPIYKSDFAGQPKKYGIEYRTLSNFWLSHPAIMQVTWEIGRRTVSFATSEYRGQWIATEAEVIEAITNSDVKLATSILKRNKLMFKWLLLNRYDWTKSTVSKAFEVGLNGIDSVVKDPQDISGNWQLENKDIEIDIRSYKHKRYTWKGFASAL